LRSPRSPFQWLLVKEWRELVSSRAWWVLLLFMGPLVGYSFISAVTLYSELSGYGGTGEGVDEAFSPLIGVWAPTFSACELAAAFLLPFVAIRVVSGDRQSGALKLELQQPMPVAFRVAAKALILLAGWIVASLPTVVAVILWLAYGGSVHAPELGALAAGHLLNAGLTVGLAFAAAALTDHPATAAIVTLSFTVGTWILNFVASVHGGIWERLAAFTPTAVVAQFQRGLILAEVAVAALLLTGLGLGLAVVWTRLGVPVRRKVGESVAVCLLTVVALSASTQLKASWDLSDGRINSFRRADERLLATIRQPLTIDVYRAPEDPRRVDYERNVLSKLRRVVQNLRINYIAATSTGLFEQASEHYGEISYSMLFRTSTTRAITVESALEEIYELAGFVMPVEEAADVYRGRPLRATPRFAREIFYAAWPLIVVAVGILVHQRRIAVDPPRL
jgi:ABC-type transport system involved in multi-copper enzyme maturation permease subunit